MLFQEFSLWGYGSVDEKCLEINPSRSKPGHEYRYATSLGHLILKGLFRKSCCSTCLEDSFRLSLLAD